jgi:hypothetical protein
LEAQSCEVAIFGLLRSILLPQHEVNPKKFLPPSPTCNQIWQSLVVNDGQPTYLTKLKKNLLTKLKQKLAIDHNLGDFFAPQILSVFFYQQN